MIHREVNRGLALITMDAPPVNALGRSMREDLIEGLAEAYSD